MRKTRSIYLSVYLWDRTPVLQMSHPVITGFFILIYAQQCFPTFLACHPLKMKQCRLAKHHQPSQSIFDQPKSDYLSYFKRSKKEVLLRDSKEKKQRLEKRLKNKSHFFLLSCDPGKKKTNKKNKSTITNKVVNKFCFCQCQISRELALLSWHESKQTNCKVLLLKTLMSVRAVVCVVGILIYH